MKITELRIHQIFRISVILKGIDALIEIAGGVLFFLISKQAVLHWVNVLTRQELVSDPRDMIANAVLHAAQQLSGSAQDFYAFYLVSHGLIKLVMVAGLLREKLLAYPFSLAAMAGFIAYQLYRYSYTHAIGLIVLTVFDLIVMALIWHEWRLLRRHLPLD